MEEELDLIEAKKAKRDDVLSEFWEPFRQSLEVATTKMQLVQGQETDEKGTQCGKGLVYRYSKKTGSKFLACIGYPECTYTKGSNGETREAPVQTEHKCPTCGKPMV